MSAAEWIAKRRELLDAATEGPWFQGRSGRRYESDCDVYSEREPDDEDSHDIATYVWSAEDAALIADARTSLPRALDALTAVLDLHRLNREDEGVCQGYTSSGYGHLDRWCVECSEQSGREYGTPWPCPTVAAITEALS